MWCKFSTTQNMPYFWKRKLSRNIEEIYYRTGVLSDMEWLEWLNTTQLRYPDCVCIVESDTCPSPGVTRLYPSWLGTWLTWSPSGHCNIQWDTCNHLVAMAARERVTNQSHYMITPWGAHGRLPVLVSEYLRDRRIWVKIGTTLSDEFYMRSAWSIPASSGILKNTGY